MGLGKTLPLPEDVKSSSAVAQEAPPRPPKHLHPDQDTSSGSLSVSRAACFLFGQCSVVLWASSLLQSHFLPLGSQTSLFPLLLPLQKRSLEIKASYSGPALSPVSAGQPTPQPLDLGGFQASMSWSTVVCGVRGPVE